MTEKKEIHVVYIITKLELGGAQKVCLTLFRGLADVGSSLISGSHGYFVSQVQDEKSVYLLPELEREISPLFFIREARALVVLIKKLRELKQQHPHVIVHTHSSKAGILGRWAAFFVGIKVRIHTIHGFGFHDHQRTLFWLASYLVELITSCITTHYVCVSSADIATGLKIIPRFSQKYSLIRAAVDWHKFTPAHYTPAQFPQEQAPFIFGSIACFKPQKNLFDLLQAFELVHAFNPHTRLELIGDGILRPALEAWVKEHGLVDTVYFHGWQQEVAPIMFSWHAFVLSSLWEGLPCSVVEARLLRLPVVSYDTGGIHDVIIPARNGLLYPQKKWRALAEGMKLICSDKETFAQLQRNSEDLHQFQDTTMIKQHEELYQSFF